MFKINIANILEVSPDPINCLSLNEKTNKLALFRGGDVCAIEIWDVSHMPFMEKILVDLETVADKPSVESIIWGKNRLFSGGLHGFVLEHNLVTRKIKEKLVATSGPVWCLSVNNDETFLAAGTEDGFINIFEIAANCLQYIKVLDRQDGRVLSISWSPCGKFIATGSTDSIRLWEVERGHAIRRIITGRSKNKETIVWSILLLDNLTIVSGDSRGIISFWSGEHGVLRFRIYSHKADVLSVKLSSDESSLYAAGVDPVVVMLAKVAKNGDKWVKSHQRNMHTNDVTCLATTGNKLYSGGCDADLIVSSFPPKIVTKYPPMVNSSRISLAKVKKLALVQNNNSIDIWQLPQNNQDLLRLVQLSSKGKETILSSCISPNGSYFVYSVFGKISFFNLCIPDVKPSDPPPVPIMKKLKMDASSSVISPDIGLDFHENPHWHMRFIDNVTLVLVSVDGTFISFVQIDNETEVVLKNVVAFDDSFIEVGINMIEVSPNGKYIAIISGGSVTISEIDSYKLNEPIKTPNYECPATVTIFHPDQPLVLIAYVDRCVKIFNFKIKKIVYDTELKNSNCLQAVLGGAWSPKGDNIVLYDIDGLYLIETNIAVSKPKKKPRKSSVPSIDDEDQCSFSMKSGGNNYKYVAFVDFLNDGEELLTVEVKPASLLEKLPPAFAKKRFGM